MLKHCSCIAAKGEGQNISLGSYEEKRFNMNDDTFYIIDESIYKSDIHLSISSIFIFVYLSIYLYLSIQSFIYINIFVCLSIYLCDCAVHIYVYLTIYLSINISVFSSIYLSIHITVYLYIYHPLLSIYLYTIYTVYT